MATKKLIKKVKSAPAKKVKSAPAKKLTKPRKVKPTRTVCVNCPGAKGLVLHRIKDMHRNSIGQLLCDACYVPEPTRRPKAEKPPGTWYVLQVDPGSETQVRADIMKQCRVRNLDGRIRRVMSPACLVEKVGPRVGDVLAKGTHFPLGDNPRRQSFDDAREVAITQAHAVHCRREGLDPDDTPVQDSYPGLRVQCFPGKTPGTVDWKVCEYNELETVRRVVKGRKYPGYMLVDMDYDEETAHVIKSTRNTWGLLLQPVVTGHLIKITERKSTLALSESQRVNGLGFNWRVVEPGGGKCVGKGWAPTKAEARAAAEKCKLDAEAFTPTRLADQEAAEALIAQTAVNQILKDKEELNKAVVNLRPGDRVRVKVGAFRDCKGEVMRILRDKADKTTAAVECKLNIMGRDVPLTVQHYELERLTPGDR